jgi:phospholipid/cholesterol/gamma-HCH transport system permease protein
MTKLRHSDNVIFLEGDILIGSIGPLLSALEGILGKYRRSDLTIDLSGVTRIDSAGVALLDEVLERAKAKNISIQFINAREMVAKTLVAFSTKGLGEQTSLASLSIFEKIGGATYQTMQDLLDLVYLIADTIYFAAIGLVRRSGIRKGEFINQSILIGMNAFPIVALIAFLIGFILALQSAAQLRQFGASIFVADLVAISMTREMGPIMTAIVFAGRSGSAIASEIATMMVTEETDALKSMALNPVRYVVVPKFYAITLTMPLLTILSMLIGIFGAMVIGYTYLGIGIMPFYQQAVDALIFRDIITGLIKSVVFAWIIVITGAYYGFRVKGGAQGVGKTTTASVVASVFLVILADSALGLLFYFGKGFSF